MEIRRMCAWACLRKTEARWALRALPALLAAVVLWPNFAAPLLAQTENRERRANHHAIEVPESTNELAQDVGVRAHTAHLILLRPERIHQARVETPVGETPGSLACVYQTSGASLSSGCRISGNLASGNNGLPNPSGGSQTIAIVDAYDYPTAYNDLTVFSKQFGLPVLPQCSGASASACFETRFASGTKPASNGSWALEEALDIEWAHAMSPQARIVLVEASSSSLAALFQAVALASQVVTENAGSGEVSMSWGSSEFAGETSYDSYFQTSGVVYFAAAGDSGGRTTYPSVSPDVVSAGGTTVNRNASGAFVSETAWSGGGGGPSAYESVPSYQDPVSNLVGTKRGTPDFSFDANPNTGVFVYDSTPYAGSRGWWLVGGTSVASPSLAGIVNLAGSFRASSGAELGLIYSICGVASTSCSSADFRDITSGSTGRYNSAVGWDFTAGVGSVQGIHGK